MAKPEQPAIVPPPIPEPPTPPQQPEIVPAIEPVAVDPVAIIPEPTPDPPIQQKVEEITPQLEPIKSMSLKTFLQHAGEDILKVFQFADKAATLSQPFVAIANPAIGSLMGTTLVAIQQAEALGLAASATGNTGPAKAASVIQAITPTVTSTLVNLGVPASEVNSKMVTAYVNAFVALLNTLPAPPA